MNSVAASAATSVGGGVGSAASTAASATAAAAAGGIRMGAADASTAFIEASAAAGNTLMGGAVMSQSSSAAGTSADVPNRVLDYPYDFFKDGKVPKNADEAAMFWQYREDRPLGLADRETPDGEKMFAEMKRIKSELGQHVQRSFDERAIVAAGSLNLTFANGQCRQEPKTAADLKKAVAELGEPSRQNIEIFWRLLYHPFLHRDWSSKVIDAWLQKENKKLCHPPAPSVHSETGKKIGRLHINARGGWTTIATANVSNRRRYYSDTLMNECGWKFCNTAPKGGSNQETFTKNGLTYTRTKVVLGAEDNDREPEAIHGWLVEKVKYIVMTLHAKSNITQY